MGVRLEPRPNKRGSQGEGGTVPGGLGDGVDYMYAGVIRSVNTELLQRQLQVPAAVSRLCRHLRLGRGWRDRVHDFLGLQPRGRGLLRVV